MAAAGTIKTLLVKLGVDSAGYEKDLTAAEKRAKQFDKVLMGAFAGAAAAAGALIAKSTMLAARVETLGVVVTQLGKSANYTQDQLDAYEASIKSQGITTKNTLQSMAQMMQAQIDLAHGSDLARIAQDNAVIANINSSEAFKRLVTVLQTGNIRMARTMGLNLDFAGATKRLAAELGKTTQELTQQEVMQARLNEVKKAGVAIEGTYTAAMGTAGKTMLSLDRQFEEISLAIGDIFLPALTEAVSLIYEAAKGINKFISIRRGLVTQEKDIAKAIFKTGGTYEEYIQQVTAAAREQGLYVYTLEDLEEVQGSVRESVRLTAEGIMLLTEAQIEERRVAEHNTWLMDAYAQVMDGLATTTESAATGTRAMSVSMEDVEKAASEAESAVSTFWGTLREGPGIVSALESNLEALDYSQAGAGAIAEAQEEIEEALALGLISEAEADQAFGNLYVAAQQIEVELGNITAYQAALNIRENVGGSLSEARTAVGNLESDLLKLVEKELELRIKAYISYGDLPTEADLQHGGTLTVPPGFPNDSYRVGLTSGEEISVTKPGGQGGDDLRQDNRSLLEGANITINTPVSQEIVNDWIEEFLRG